MNKFKFMEFAVNEPFNRNRFAESKNVIQFPFKKENRFKELWRGMFLYETNEPSEESAMFGNFYLECDAENFKDNQRIMLEVSEYLHRNYEIPYIYFDYFYTNRSIWLVIPAKVFSCYGSAKLHKVYKEMAEEIQNHLLSKGIHKGLDTSIYKWNGLIHTLGSYLKKSKRWVTKFSYFDLEKVDTEKELLQVQYDTYFTLADIQPIATASRWFKHIKNRVFGIQEEKDYSSYFKNCDRVCMKKLEEQGEILVDRNLHIYTYSLYLKELGYSTDEAIEKVQSTFSNHYVFLKECSRTIRSAIEGSKHFNCKTAKSLLQEDLFDCSNCKSGITKTTFVLPRKFITDLHNKKAHYRCYKLLFEIAYTSQILKEDYVYSLKKEKYKKLVTNYFETLSELGFISYHVTNNHIQAKLIWKDKKEYTSHIVIPNQFIESNSFLNMKSEIKVLVEIWRSSIQVGTKEKTLFFNVKWENVCKKLHMTMKVFLKYLCLLRKAKLVLRNFLFVVNPKNQWKKKMRTIIAKMKNKVIQKCENKSISGSILSLRNLIKNIYSPYVTFFKKRGLFKILSSSINESHLEKNI